MSILKPMVRLLTVLLLYCIIPRILCRYIREVPRGGSGLSAGGWRFKADSTQQYRDTMPLTYLEYRVFRGWGRWEANLSCGMLGISTSPRSPAQQNSAESDGREVQPCALSQPSSVRFSAQSFTNNANNVFVVVTRAMRPNRALELLHYWCCLVFSRLKLLISEFRATIPSVGVYDYYMWYWALTVI